MPVSKKNHRKNTSKRYSKQTFGKSVFDGKPTLITYRYRVPKPYQEAVSNVISAFRNGTSFNTACDQVAASDPDHINRNKLAEHTLKFIANS